MFRQIIIFISIFSLSCQIEHCIRTYEICTKCNTGYFVVQNEYQYICSPVKDCLFSIDNICYECTADILPDANFNC